MTCSSGLRSGEPRELLDAGRARHVDLGEALADDVEPDEHEPVRAEPRRHRLHHRQLGVRELGGDHAPPDVDVRAQIVGARDAQDGAERLAVEEQDALVAHANRRAGTPATMASCFPSCVSMSTIARAF